MSALDALKNPIGALVKSHFKGWMQRNIKTINKGGGPESDFDEIIEDVGIVIDGSEDVLASANLPQLMAGFAAIGEGVKTVIAAVDVDKAKAAVRVVGPALLELIQLSMGIFAEVVPMKRLVAEGEDQDEDADKLAYVSIDINAERFAEANPEPQGEPEVVASLPEDAQPAPAEGDTAPAQDSEATA